MPCLDRPLSSTTGRASRRCPSSASFAATAAAWRCVLTFFACLLVAAPGALAAGVLVPENTRDRNALRMVDHLVDVKIVDRIAITTLTQSFENTTDQRLEGTYIFPIAEGADLTNFKLSFNGKMVEGEVLPAEEAKEIYESIVRRMKDPGLIEFIGRRLLKARIFPIEPKSTTTIEIQYQQVIDTTGGVLRYAYPLRTPGHDSRAYGKVAFNVDLNMPNSQLKTVWSPSHNVEVVRDGEHRATVAFEETGADLNRDFMLLLDTDDSDVGFSLVTNLEDEDRFFLAVISPQQIWKDAEDIPSDYVFVVDTSGSMAGEKLEQSREALKFCVQSLKEDDRFSIIRFSTGRDILFEDLRKVSKSAREEAIDSINQYSARGGTNIHDALKAAVDLFDDAINADGDKADSRRKVLVFLTDGQGERTREDIEKMLETETSSTLSKLLRIFPFGVGTDVNTKLLDALATGHGGVPTYVQPGENLEYALGDFFSIFSAPVLTNLELTLPDVGTHEMYPPNLGDLYHGRQMVVVGQFDESGTGRVVLTGRRGDESVRYVWENIRFDDESPAGFSVGRLWAGRKIAYLIDRIRLVGESDELMTELVDLSTKYGIQTPYTSWLVTPEGRPLEQPMMTRGGRGIGGVPESFAVPSTRGVGGAAPGSQESGWSDEILQSAQMPQDRAMNAEDEATVDPALQPVVNLVRSASTATAEEAGRRRDAGDDAWMGQAADADSGLAAVQLGTALREMRGGVGDGGGGAAGQINSRDLAYRRISGRLFRNVAGALIDTRVGEVVAELERVNEGRGETDRESIEYIDVRFGSDAYFDVVMARPDLREVLAASSYTAIMLDDRHALLIDEESGVETMNEEQMKLIRDTAPKKSTP